MLFISDYIPFSWKKKCIKCNFQTTLTDDMQIHMREAHSLGRFWCFNCRLMFDGTVRNMRQHVAICHRYRQSKNMFYYKGSYTALLLFLHAVEQKWSYAAAKNTSAVVVEEKYLTFDFTFSFKIRQQEAMPKFWPLVIFRILLSEVWLSACLCPRPPYDLPKDTIFCYQKYFFLKF